MKIFRNAAFSVYVSNGRVFVGLSPFFGQRGLAVEVVLPPVALAICLYCTIIMGVLSSNDNSTDAMRNVSRVMQSFLTT